MKRMLLFICICTLFISLSSCSNRSDEEALNITATAVAADIYSTQAVIARTQSAQATLDAIPTSTPTITLTPTPTPIPALIGDWDNYSIQTLCLDTHLEYPQFEEDLKVPVASTTINLLELMGFKVVQPDDACEATLTIRLNLESIKENYQESDTNEKITCYSGSRADGFMRLEAEGLTPLDTDLRNSYTPPLISTCNEDPSSNVAFKLSWLPEVTAGLTEFWGISAAVAALRFEESSAQIAALENYKYYEEDMIALLPYLLPIVEAGGTTLTPHSKMEAALNILEELGPKAIEAVPLLIVRIEKELEKSDSTSEFAPPSEDWRYNNALVQITEVKGEADPEFWWAWWEANKPAGIE